MNVSLPYSIKQVISVALFFLCITAISNKSIAQLPPHFYDKTVYAGLTHVEGVVFDHNKRMYAWEKEGKVWIIDSNGVMNPTALLVNSKEVGDWVDHGLNGIALDPDFEHNGYLYASYVVDRHHLLYFGTPNYNKDSDEYYNATIARITRYTCDSADNFNSIVQGSRLVLLGEDKKTGIPVLHLSHSACGIIFGSDGTLIVPTGDGGAYGTMDNGGGTISYWAQGLLDSIITPEENVGAFRSQMLNSLNGKILRIDPATGDGVPSNPYYDPQNPRSAQSRTWSLGMRNPFTISLKPGTGSTNPADGNPGVFYVGDVGWNTWEELDIVDKPKQNFGWPIYEGLDFNVDYKNALTPDYDAPNPLYGTGTCTQQYFNFQDLLFQQTLDTTITFNNPCDTAQQIADTLTYFHTRPVIEYRHAYDSAMVAAYNGNDAVSISIDDSLSPCAGEPFGGDCIIGGAFYTGTTFPVEYQNKYFFGEFEDEWIRRLSLDSNNVPYEVNVFAEKRGYMTHVTEDKFDGSIIYIHYPNEIHKICYACMPDSAPVAIALADTLTGIDSVLVTFDGSQSYDPDNGPLTYSWDFGDGNSSSLMSPQHEFTAPANILTTYMVILTVTDDSSHTASDTLYIVMNNTPPQVQITSFNDGDFYTINQPTNFLLQANVIDAQQPDSELTYEWKIYLNINGTDLLQATDTNRITSYLIQPYGCGTDTIFYKIILSVTDSAGLTGTDQNNIYPDCSVPDADFSWTNNPICAGDSVYFNDLTTHYPASWQWTFTGGNPASSTLQSPVVSYTSGGSYNAILAATNPNGTTYLSQTVLINNLPVINLGNDTSICANSSLVLDAGNNGATYLWNDGSTNSSLAVSSAGTYSVFVTDSNSCKNSDTISVGINPLPVVNINPMTDTICQQSNPVSLSGNPNGGIFSGNGVTGNLFSPVFASVGWNVITYNYTDSLGCSNVDSTSIWVDPCLSISENNSNDLLIYPNPAHDKLFIKTNGTATDFKFKISDVSGKILMEQSYKVSKSTEEISIKDFAKGIYFIEVSYDGKNYFRKFMVE